MYLSRVTFDSTNSLGRRDLASAYEMHRTLCSGFPGVETGRLLFRHNGRGGVLLLSPKEPDFDAPLKQGRLKRVDTKPFQVSVGAGQVLRFALRANPTKKKEGSRIPFVDGNDQIAWLQRKAEQHGFSLRQATVAEAVLVKTRKSGKGKPVTHLSVDFHGVLSVEDPKRFEETLVAGIGSAKSFGFGLLCVSP